MYDAKQKPKNKNEELRFNSICDRSYFNKSKTENIMSTKTSYVPSENLFLQ